MGRRSWGQARENPVCLEVSACCSGLQPAVCKGRLADPQEPAREAELGGAGQSQAEQVHTFLSRRIFQSLSRSQCPAQIFRRGCILTQIPPPSTSDSSYDGEGSQFPQNAAGTPEPRERAEVGNSPGRL